MKDMLGAIVEADKKARERIEKAKKSAYADNSDLKNQSIQLAKQYEKQEREEIEAFQKESESQLATLEKALLEKKQTAIAASERILAGKKETADKIFQHILAQ